MGNEGIKMTTKKMKLSENSAVYVQTTVSHHGSDCPNTPHDPGQNRCITTVCIRDSDKDVSYLICIGDKAESVDLGSPDGTVKIFRGTDWKSRMHFGGAFWEKVEFFPPVSEEDV